jgi:hypothetical protein
MIIRQAGEDGHAASPPGSPYPQAGPRTCANGTKAAPIRRLPASGKLPGTSVRRGDGASRCMNIRARIALTLRAAAAGRASLPGAVSAGVAGFGAVWGSGH